MTQDPNITNIKNHQISLLRPAAGRSGFLEELIVWEKQ
ncbi:hypothetical protein JMA_12260 [Jeotgalibacillus malaysiensis]|uniref:Uncharacterized protein n=1 Tax=Jeotgalibacillus malaysiensis TaxID=1508404 RepID=A0A0B5APW4_9BACL|nr:hypothetical protein JMA_12260 [Jeotgalibacillus malaysiensis]